MNLTCSVSGCMNNPPRLIKGVCPMHDSRMRAWGHYGSAGRMRTPGRVCSVAACRRPHVGRGYCQGHLDRVREHGDPLAHIPIANVRRRLTLRVCSVVDCQRKHWARGYCSRHYKRWAANGTPDLRTPAERFWAQVDRHGNDECWPWTGATVKGYGHSHWGRQHYYAHRKSYELANGVVLDPSVVVRHRCDNPPCVNPAHLEAGTQADNVRDMVDRGRGHWQRRSA